MSAKRTATSKGIVGVLAVGAALAACAAQTDGERAAPSSAPPETFHASAVKDPGWEGWRKDISKTRPPTDGCFRSSYPSTTWTEVPCGPAPVDYIPASHARPVQKLEARPAEVPLVVGGGTDWTATTTGTFGTVTGSFPSVTGGAGPSAYSLQLNTNPFPSKNALCGGVSTCQASQQAVYSTSGNPDGLFFEYVLLGLKSCSSGWTGDGSGNCYKASATVPGIPLVALADLPSMKLQFQAGSSDVIIVTIEGTAYTGVFPSVLGVNTGPWNQAEFGVFGPNDSQQLSFTNNTTIVTQLITEFPGDVSCTVGEITLESNNLSLLPGNHCCLALPGNSGIEFVQSNVAGQACTVCGGENQPCCTVGKGWCASASDVCYSQTCMACGGNGEPCCAGNTCTSAGVTCQAGACGPPDTLVASPSALSVEAGDGASGINSAVTNFDAAGYWTTTGGPPTFSFTSTSVPPGVVKPPPGSMPAGLTWAVTNNISPPTVRITAGTGAVAGAYKFTVTGTIGTFQATAPLNVTVNGCQPVTCAAAHWVCGSVDNGCGATVSCGTCPSGESCTGGACYACAERQCPAKEFFNPTTCQCQACKCGTITVGGKSICAVCKP